MSRVTGFLLALLTLTGAYLFAAPAPTLLYGIGVIAHVVAGVAALVLLLRFAREFAGPGLAPRLGWGLVVAGGVAGLVLIAVGATLPHRSWFWAHVSLSTAGAAVFIAWRLRAVGLPALVRYAGVFAVFSAAGYGAWHVREVSWKQAYRIENQTMPPASMDQEGHGRTGPFFPSSIRTPDGKHIKSSFFMDSKAVRAVPRRHLQAVEQLGAPLLVVQQPVVPQVHRVHAGRQRHPVRRSGAAAATTPR